MSSSKVPSTYKGTVFTPSPPSKAKSRRKCIVPKCNSKYDSETYHTFPNNKKFRKIWQVRCRLTNIKIADYDYICGKHFLSSDYIKGKGKGECENPRLSQNAVPSQNMPVARPLKPITLQDQQRSDRAAKRMLQRDGPVIEMNSTSDQFVDIKPDSDIDRENEIFLTVEQALHLGVPVPKQMEERGIQVNTLDDTLPRMNVMDLLTTESKLNSWTGIPSYDLLHAIDDCVCTGYPEEMERQSLSVLERILLCFIKLKTKLTFACMTSIFCITNSSISLHFNSMLPLVKEALSDVVYFPSSEETKLNLPIAFRKYEYDAVRAILDCSEVKIQSLKCINCRICTYSRYKKGHTFKFMVAITPAGLISHASKAYSGKASDKFIFNKENLIDKFDPHNDAIMMDKGTLIEEELLERYLQMVRPSFFRSEIEQFEEVEQICNTKVAKLRVHVERAIQRMKFFSILSDQMEWNVLPQVDNIIFVCAAMANLTKPILHENKF